MEQLIYEVAGKKYLLVELPIPSGDEKKMSEKCKKFECIYQGVKELNRGGFFSRGFAIIKILVPEENVLAFNAD